MGQQIDLTGKKLGRLTVIGKDLERFDLEMERFKNGEIKCSPKPYWKCKCSCESGVIKTVNASKLNAGKILSCGCLINETRGQSSKKANKIEAVSDGKSKIWNTKETDYTLVDTEFVEQLKGYCWRKNSRGYWFANVRGYSRKEIGLHQLVGQIASNNLALIDVNGNALIPDHIDRNKSNNTKENIVLKTQSENTKNKTKPINNSSGKMGVSWSKLEQMWTAYITVEKKRKHLGYFNNLGDAVEARLKAEEKYGFIGE